MSFIIISVIYLGHSQTVKVVGLGVAWFLVVVLGLGFFVCLFFSKLLLYSLLLLT